MKSLFKFGLCGLLTLLIFACNRNNADAITEQGEVAKTELVAALDTLSKAEFTSFYSKIATSYEDSARSNSFKTSVWMISDSASNFLISYASFPIIGALVTQDSVHVSNKKDKCYSHASLDFLRAQFGVEFTLGNLENILLGIPTNFDATRTYYQVGGKNGRTLCTHGLKDIEQIKLEGTDEIVMYYTLSEDLSVLESTTVVSMKDSTEINVAYKTREVISGMNVPSMVEIRILSPRQVIKVDLEYSKTRINDDEPIHFVIPDSYEECK